MTTLVNGQPGSQISLSDRGFSYGDGVFETVLVEAGKTLLLARHLGRMKRGLKCLGIDIDQAFTDCLAAEIEQLAQGGGRRFIKLIVTRGQGGRGYKAAQDLQPTRVVMSGPATDYPQQWYQQGSELFLCRTRLGLNPQLAGIKHLNRLEQVLARREWHDQYPEGLVCDINDQLIEGTMSNLFLISGKRLLTAKLDQCGVAGIVRSVIIDWAQKNNVEVLQQRLRLDDLLAADGAFLTNTGFGVLPISGCAGRSVPLSPITQTASQWLDEARGCES